MTLYQITDIINKIALAQPNVHSFVGEFLDLNSSDAKYSSVVLQQITHRRNNDFITYSYYLGYADRLSENKSNEVEVQSTAIQVIDSIVYKLEEMGIDTSLGAYNTFTQRFLAEAAGAYAELNITVPVGECNDDFAQDKLDVEITENGEYNYIPKGLGYQNVHLNVNVQGGEINNQDKTITIVGNYTTTIIPEPGYTGFGTVEIITDVHPIEKLTKTYTENGDYVIDGEYNGAEITVNVHPTATLTASITDNGHIQHKGEYNGIDLTVDVHPTETLTASITDNGRIQHKGDYNGIDLTVDVHPENKLTETYTENGTYDIDGEYNGGEITVNVDTQASYDQGYAEGEAKGKTEGINEQKAKLEDITITENGTYNKEDGYKSVVVNVPSGSGSGVDFSIIGYDSDVEGVIQSSVNYSKALKDAYRNVYPDTDEDFLVYGNNYINDDLIYVPVFNTADRQDFTYMFGKCDSLSIVPQLPMTNAITCAYMFQYCPNIQYIPNLNLPNITTLYGMFYYAGIHFPLTFTNLSTTTEYSIGSMFNECKIYCYETSDNYIELDLTKCNNANRAFYFTTFSQKTGSKIILHNTSNISNWGECFAYSNVETITGLNVSNASETPGAVIEGMFYGCTALKNISFEGSINDTIQFYSSLKYDSVKSILTAASNTTYSSVGDSKIVFNVAITLTDKDSELSNLVASCTSKGWTITGLTLQ